MNSTNYPVLFSVAEMSGSQRRTQAQRWKREPFDGGKQSSPQSAHKKKDPSFLESFLKKLRQRPTLPQNFSCSTIGSMELNGRVRDGNGCDLHDIATAKGYRACAFCRSLCCALFEVPHVPLTVRCGLLIGRALISSKITALLEFLA